MRYYRYAACVDAFQLGVETFPTWFAEAMLDNKISTVVVGKNKEGRTKIDAFIKSPKCTDHCKDGDFMIKQGGDILCMSIREFELTYGVAGHGRLL